MVSRSVAIGIGILVLVLLGFLFFSNMTGNVITGSVANEETVETESFKIVEADSNVNEEIMNGAQNNG